MPEEQTPNETDVAGQELATITPATGTEADAVDEPAKVEAKPQKQEPKLANRTLKGLDAEDLEMLSWARDKFPGNQTTSIMRGLAFARAAMADIEKQGDSPKEPDFVAENLVNALGNVKRSIDRQTELLRPLVTSTIEESEANKALARQHQALVEQLTCDLAVRKEALSCREEKPAKSKKGKKRGKAKEPKKKAVKSKKKVR